MEKKIDRKTVFLYPDLATLTRKEVCLTNALITNINLVVDSANALIQNILCSGNFSFINCMPTVLMTSVCEDFKKNKVECSNVRICISAYDDIDYTENYAHLINNYKTGCSDISHLVAVHISDKFDKTQFTHDNAGNFDVIVKTNLDYLENVLVSIMLDISLYHYFLLSNDLSYRRSFNKIKYEHLLKTPSNILENIYGFNPQNQKLIYLPISLGDVSQLENYTTVALRHNFIDELINNYANFLATTTATKIECNERGSIINASQHASIKNYSAIESYIRNAPPQKNKMYYILVPDILTKNTPISMIQYNEETGKVSTWIKKEFEDICSYQIIQVIWRNS